MRSCPYILFISGPTASGKTDFSLELAKELSKNDLSAQIINADIGQFYEPLSIGTAKPDWRSFPIKHNLFDIVKEPKDFNVVDYRDLLLKKVNDIWNNGELPIIVGGSLFYIRSLFMPPITSAKGSRDNGQDVSYGDLVKLDPERAKAIHPGDTYRIKRALAIWEQTGKKPSECEPVFNPGFHARVLFITPPREILYERINKRTHIMMKTGWIDEVKNLRGTLWEKFLKEKKLIGYPQIFDWLELSESDREKQFSALVEDIQIKTRNYAKRQVTFWKKFRTLSTGDSTWLCEMETIEGKYGDNIGSVVGSIKDDVKQVCSREGEL